MKAILQRVRRGKVSVEGRTVAQIDAGLVILVGVGHSDTEEQVRFLVEKIVHLRIFEDGQGKMNLSILDTGGQAIVVSQFTLYADTRRGRRPSFTDAAPPDLAAPLVDRFVALMQEAGVEVWQGEFGAHMVVEIENDGPVTISLES